MKKTTFSIIGLLLIGLIAINPISAYVDEMTHAKERELMSKAYMQNSALNENTNKPIYDGVYKPICTRATKEENYYLNLEVADYKTGIQVLETNKYHDAMVVINGKLYKGKLTIATGCGEKKGDLFDGKEIIVLDDNKNADYFIRG